MKDVDPHGCLLGTQRLRLENLILRRKLRNAWLALWALVAVVLILCGFMWTIMAGGLR